MGRIGSDLAVISEKLRSRSFRGEVLESMNVPAMICGLDFRIIFISRPLLELLNKAGEPAEHVGRDLDGFLYGREQLDAVYRLAVQTGAAAREENFRLADGNSLVLRLEATPIYQSQGTTGGVPAQTPAGTFAKHPLGVFTRIEDLTEVRRRQAELLDLGRRLRDAARSVADRVGRLEDTASALAGQIGHTRLQAEKYESGVNAAADYALELSGLLLAVVDRGSEVATLAAEVERKAADGAERSGRSGRELDEVGRAAVSLVERMLALSSQAEEIRKLLQGIRDIAAQANLLALNTIIEADLRGEAGKNFSRLAGEVRILSEKTAEVGVLVDGFLGEINRSLRQNQAAAEDLAGRAAREARDFQGLEESMRCILGVSGRLGLQARALAEELEVRARPGESVNRCLEEQRRASQHTVLALVTSEEGLFRLAELSALVGGQVEKMVRQSEQFEQAVSVAQADEPNGCPSPGEGPAGDGA